MQKYKKIDHIMNILNILNKNIIDRNQNKIFYIIKTFYIIIIIVTGVKNRENPICLKKGKMVISVKIRNFSRSRMMK